MSFSPNVGLSENGSPSVSTANICMNLDKEFENARDSVCAESMHVFARIRPMLPHEKKKGFKECIAAIDETTVKVLIPSTSSKFKSSRQKEAMCEYYTFTGAFGPETGQFVFFHDTMLHSMENFVDGNNSLLFSYGITGSGKTYTLQGDSDNPGVLPLSLKLYFAVHEKQIMQEIKVKPHMYNDILALSESDSQKEYKLRHHILSQYDAECDLAPGSFRTGSDKSFAVILCNLFSDSYKAEERTTTLCAEDMASAQAVAAMQETIQKCADSQLGVCNVWVSFIEIYNESIFDLLQSVKSNRTRLSLGEDKNGKVYIKGVQEVCVFNSDEALKILNIGRKNLSIASTKMNYQSSRSHCIYTIKVVRVPDVNNTTLGRVSRFSFCDLAGSERASKAQTTGVHLKEAGAINTSLLVLGRCLEMIRLNQMSGDNKRIPFRESKLTRIFSGFFMGEGKAVMITNASPCDFTVDETLHVLKFSAVAKKLMMSSFFSDASSVIQSICSEWKSQKSNISINDESTASIDSDYSDIISQKDDIIEKLLAMVEDFQEKARDLADMEMRIRAEVCQEYSEYSDQLLENRRITFEEEKNALKQIYEKRLGKMEKMYEDIIQEYKDQLSMCENESLISEKSIDASKSLQDLDVSSISAVSPSPESKITRTESRITDDLHSKDAISNSAEITLKYKAELQEMEELLASAREELSSCKELVQNKEFTINELEADNEEIKINIETLKKEIEKLNNQKSHDAEDVENYKAKTSQLMQENFEFKSMVESLKKEIVELKNSHSGHEDDLENNKSKIVQLTKEIMDYKKEMAEFSNYRTLCEADAEKFKAQISALEKDLQNANKNTDTIRKEMNLRETVSKNLDKEIETHKEELKNLKNSYKALEKQKEDLEAQNLSYKVKLKEFETEKLSLEEANLELNKKLEQNMKDMENLQTAEKQCELLTSTISDKVKVIKELEDGFLTVNDKLKNAESDVSEKNTLIKDLKCKIDNCSNELKKMKVDYEDLEMEKLRLEVKENIYKTEIKEIEEKLSSKEKEYDVEKLNENLLAVEKEKTKLSNDVSDNEKKINSLESQLSDLQLELEKKKGDIMEKNSTIENLKSKIQTSDRELSEANQKLLVIQKKCEQYIEELKETVRLTEKEKQCVMVTVSDKEKKLRELEESLSVAIMTKDSETEKDVIINDLKTTIDTYKGELENLRNSYNALEIQKGELEAQKLSYDLKLKEFETEKLSLEAANLELNKKLEQNMKGMEDLQTAEKQCELLTSTISDKDKVIKELEDKVLTVNDELNSAEKDVSEKNTLITDLKCTIDTYKGELETMRNSYKTLEIQKGELEAQKLSYDLKLKEFETEKLSLEEANLELNEKLERNMKGMEDLQTAEKQYELLTSTISDKDKVIKELEDKVLTVNDELKNAENDVSEKNTLIKDLRSKIDSYSNELKKMEMGYKILETEKLNLEVKENAYKTEMKEIEEKLSSKEKEHDVEKLKENLLAVEKEKAKLANDVSDNEKKINSLEGKLADLQFELKTEKENMMEKNTTIERLKSTIDNHKGELENLKNVCKKLEIEKGDLEAEKLSLKEANFELNKRCDNYIKSLKNLEEDLLKTKKQNKLFISTISDKDKIIKELEVKLLAVNGELKNAESDVSEKNTLIKDLKSKIDHHCNELEEVKIDYKKLEAEKVSLEATANSYKTKIGEIEEKLSSEEKENVEKLKENLLAAEKEMKRLTNEVSDKEKKIKSLEGKLLDLQLELKTEKENVIERNTSIENLKSKIDTHCKELVEVKTDYKKLEAEKLSLEDTVDSYRTKIKVIEEKRSSEEEENVEELKAGLLAAEKEKKKLTNEVSDKQKKIKSLESKLSDLQHELKTEKENVIESNTSIENLKLSLKEAEMKLKDSQKLWNDKLMSEKEQHEVEIKGTLKLKHELQDENALLKEENLNLKEVKSKEKDLAVAGKRALPKRTTSLKVKETLTEKSESKGLKKYASTRSVQIRQTRVKEIFSDIDSDAELEIPKPRSRKRVSDDDFDPVKEKVSKKVKPAETKIPLRKTKRNLETDKTETLSPIKKAANAVTSKVRAIASNMTTKMSSPRLTRGRRKLYNPDEPSTSGLDKVSTRRK